jgi:hypothetical protein
LASQLRLLDSRIHLQDKVQANSSSSALTQRNISSRSLQETCLEAQQAAATAAAVKCNLCTKQKQQQRRTLQTTALSIPLGSIKTSTSIMQSTIQHMAMVGIHMGMAGTAVRMEQLTSCSTEPPRK